MGAVYEAIDQRINITVALKETLFARVRIAADDPPRVLPTKDGVELKLRFRKAVASAG